MGDSMLRVWPSAALDAIDQSARASHHAPIVGAVCRAPTPIDTSQRMFRSAAAHSGAASVGAVGPYRAQRMQHDSIEVQERVLAECRCLDHEQICQTAPVLDVLQSMHDRLYSRLFQS